MKARRRNLDTSTIVVASTSTNKIKVFHSKVSQMVLIKKRTKLGKVQHFLTKLQMFSKPAHNKNTALYIFSTEVPLYRGWPTYTKFSMHVLYGAPHDQFAHGDCC